MVQMNHLYYTQLDYYTTICLDGDRVVLVKIQKPCINLMLN